MKFIIDSLTARPFVTLAVGAFLSGVALLYLVMQRARKHRLRQLEASENSSGN